MKRFIAVAIFTFALSSSHAQVTEPSYIYLEGMPNRPFTAKLDDQLISSTGNDFLIIPKVEAGVHKLALIFMDAKIGTQTYKLPIEPRQAAGYKLSMGSTGQVVLNAIQMTYDPQMAGVTGNGKTQIAKTKEGNYEVQNGTGKNKLRINIANDNSTAAKTTVVAKKTAPILPYDVNYPTEATAQTPAAAKDAAPATTGAAKTFFNKLLGEPSKDGVDVKGFGTKNSSNTPQGAQPVTSTKQNTQSTSPKAPEQARYKAPNVTNEAPPAADAAAVEKLRRQYEAALTGQRAKDAANEITTTVAKTELEEKLRQAKAATAQAAQESIATEQQIREEYQSKLAAEKARAEAEIRAKREREEKLLAANKSKALAQAKQQAIERALAIEQSKEEALLQAKADSEAAAQRKAIENAAALEREKRLLEERIARENASELSRKKADADAQARKSIEEESMRIAKQKAELETLIQKEKQAAIDAAKAQFGAKAEQEAQNRARLLQSKNSELESKFERERAEATAVAKREAEEQSRLRLAQENANLQKQTAELEARIELERQTALAKLKTESAERAKKIQDEEAKSLERRKAEIEARIAREKTDALQDAKNVEAATSKQLSNESIAELEAVKKAEEFRILSEQREAMAKVQQQTQELARLKEQQMALELTTQKQSLEEAQAREKEQRLTQAKMQADEASRLQAEIDAKQLAAQKEQVSDKILRDKSASLVAAKEQAEAELEALQRKTTQELDRLRAEEAQRLRAVQESSTIDAVQNINTEGSMPAPQNAEAYTSTTRVDLKLNSKTSRMSSQKEMNDLFQKLEAKPDEDARIAFIRKTMNKNTTGFSCQDIAQLSQSFSTQTGKFELVKAALPFVLDLGNATTLEDIFSFDSFKDKVRIEVQSLR